MNTKEPEYHETLRVRVTAELKTAIERQAALANLTPSAYVRRLLESAIKGKQNPTGLARAEPEYEPGSDEAILAALRRGRERQRREFSPYRW